VSLAVALARAGRLDDAPLVVDLSWVTFMDASTVGALVASANRLRARGQSLQLRAPSPRALRVLELCDLAQLTEQQPASRSGAPALVTWIDTESNVPAGEVDAPDGRVAARAERRAPARVLVTAHATVKERAPAAKADRGGR
jgi:anti-anti-sigma factor